MHTLLLPARQQYKADYQSIGDMNLPEMVTVEMQHLPGGSQCKLHCRYLCMLHTPLNLEDITFTEAIQLHTRTVTENNTIVVEFCTHKSANAIMKGKSC